MATDCNFKYQRICLGQPLVYSNANSSSNNQYFGVANMTAGSVTVTAPLVEDTSVIHLTLRQRSPAGTMMAIGVSSVNPGVGFTIAANSGLTFAGSYSVIWDISRRTT